ncbi:MAG: 50S ribosomal protein L9 [Planctomycetes bacterium]|nr:50S ribosomal protein L9 [Planctomycetota bacterium]MCC8115921.1 50S ribosomal protein L9 [Planctomycetota bacterium]MCD7896253.1 50S ribosomal protein L9 [Planctomycetaceae bacterium]
MAMKLLLQEDVKDLGLAGDVVSVANGYGRNYLLPRKLAVEVTPANLKQIESMKKMRVARELERVKDFRTLAERIAAIDITVKERVGDNDTLYGSVGPKQLVDALAAEGVSLELDMIRLEEPIKTLGVHRVRVRLHPEVETELKVWVVGLDQNGPVE